MNHVYRTESIHISPSLSLFVMVLVIFPFFGISKFYYWQQGKILFRAINVIVVLKITARWRKSPVWTCKKAGEKAAQNALIQSHRRGCSVSCIWKRFFATLALCIIFYIILFVHVQLVIWDTCLHGYVRPVRQFSSATQTTPVCWVCFSL